ncbi:hypothetical protein DW096_16320 [Bacteroides sp. AM07-18]|nr:hypothetical protein [Ligilactobacillus ruminis]RGD52162.1 hypothetical protein DW096_16320 [Bacteroides sp. AM07-18]RGE73794.1 hypothetical protein DWZ47_28345 [Bacteroides sp. AF32-8BH]RGK80216.1 hypothetical protein DXC91_19845 [Bacteroides uniformis]RGN34954.1 hypothetical protein DXB67_14655 [Bacteroides caccae]RGV31862.1 hypothetical protein DWW16_18255 [Bacteroides clarus]RHE87577.1 hypothetical protein DW712_22950 [Bacteroides intestinalis]RJU13543.1 hypothetical protein DW039_172
MLLHYMFRFYYIVANVRKRNVIKSVFSVSITLKICSLFILIKQKHSAVLKISYLFAIHS